MSNALSYSNCPMTEEYMYETLPGRLRQLAEEDGERDAFVYYDHDFTRSSLSRKEVYDQSISLARVLVKNGLRNKSNVGICMTNSLNMVVTNMAVVCGGGVPVFFGGNLKDGSDVIKILNKMECETLFIDTNTGDNNWKILQNVWEESAPKSTAIPTLKTIICNGEIPNGIANRTEFSVLRKQTAADVQLPTVQPEDLITYFCTSGTTGEPKVVEYTHFNMFNFTKQADYGFGITKNSKFFCDRTFSWVVGYPRTYLVEGATRVFVDPRLTSTGEKIDKISEVIKSEKCDVVFIPNYIASDLLRNPKLASNFDHVDTALISGERFQGEFTALLGAFAKNIVVFYGTTEAGGATLFKSSDKELFESGIVGECSFEYKKKFQRHDNRDLRTIAKKIWVSFDI